MNPNCSVVAILVVSCSEWRQLRCQHGDDEGNSLAILELGDEHAYNSTERY